MTKFNKKKTHLDVDMKNLNFLSKHNYCVPIILAFIFQSQTLFFYILMSLKKERKIC